jgi:hypothetical protein
VLQGALTLWNQQPDARSIITATLRNISIGEHDQPVRGGGVFLSGSNAARGGYLRIDDLDVQSIVVDSALAEGTTDRVAAAVFVSLNAHVHRVRCVKNIDTYGPNCVALDNWGEVDEWLAESDVRSHGPSAVAIVNAGVLGSLRVLGQVETFGVGARGMSIYAPTGPVQMGSLTTHGDGAAAVHVTSPLDSLTVLGDVTTHGASGSSLVKGIVNSMPADAIDVTESGSIQRLHIQGSIIVHGDGACALRWS